MAAMKAVVKGGFAKRNAGRTLAKKPFTKAMKLNHIFPAPKRGKGRSLLKRKTQNKKLLQSLQIMRKLLTYVMASLLRNLDPTV